MASTRIWLAEAIVNDAAYLARGMAAWLRADGDHGASRKECRRILDGLVAWLRGEAAPVASLTSRRRLLARSSLVEVLKQEGLLESRDRRDDVATLLASFFDGGSVPLLPSVGTEPQERPGRSRTPGTRLRRDF
jgi:hypothetical protein